MVQRTRHASWLWTRWTEIEKGWHKGEDQGRCDCISLEGQMRSVHANMDPPPAEGNFCKGSNPVKPHVMEQYNQHMDFVDSSDRVVKNCSMRWRTFKWTTKLFFHLVDLTVLNSWILLSSCGAKYIPTEISGFYWWGIWLKKLEKTKTAPPPDWLEDQVWL